MKRNLVLMSLIALVVASTALPAMAQGVAFSATSLPRQVRVEGHTEVVGEVVLVASNAGTIKGGSSITIIYQATITNTPGATNVTTNCGDGPEAVAATGNQLTLSFTADEACILSDSIVISGIRINIAALGAGTTSVNATLSGTSSAPATNPITFTQATVQVATVISPSLLVEFPPDTLAGLATILSCSVVATPFDITIDDNFPAALTTLAQETTFSSTPAPTKGTQVLITLTNVSQGLNISGPVSPIVSGTLTFTLNAADTNAKEAGASGVLTWLYDVTASDTGAVDTITLTFTASDADGDLVQGSRTIVGDVSLSPVDDSSPFTIISFTANSQDSDDVLVVADCSTDLLFPFVANIAGFDTGIAIANTTADDFTNVNAIPQDGACVLKMWDASDGSLVGTETSSVVASGETFTMVQSASTFAGHSGYMTAECGFLNAHGFAFIVDNFGVGAPNIAQGYVALVIPATGADGRVIPAGESLGQ